MKKSHTNPEAPSKLMVVIAITLLWSSIAHGNLVDVTEAPYHADPTGKRDSTESIQRALDDLGRAGGGVVYLPEGEYRLQQPETRPEALRIRHSGLVLRGAGTNRTFLFNSDYRMRRRRVITVAPEDVTFGDWATESPTWFDPVSTIRYFSGNADVGDTEIRLQSTADLEAGMWVVLTHDVTADFVREYHREWLVDAWEGTPGVAFYRQIKAVAHDRNRVTLDMPIHYPLQVRDSARLYRVAPHIQHVGIEDLAIGMQEHPRDDFAGSAFQEPGTAGYETHTSHMIAVSWVVNGWIQRVKTYRPTSNTGPHHILGNGILLDMCRGMTLREVDIRQAQNRVGPGNGYAFILISNDSLVQDCYGEQVRYVFSFKNMYATGNVIHRSRVGVTTDGWGASDFHQRPSVANLIDNLHINNPSPRGFFSAACRSAYSRSHGRTTDRAVFWNLKGAGQTVLRVFSPSGISNQSDAVWVIGTQHGAVQVIDPAFAHHFEGLGHGASVYPSSLYESQRARRLGHPHPPRPAGTWTSRLYPEDWHPGYADDHGRVLPDFSYAGYKMGEEINPGK